MTKNWDAYEAKIKELYAKHTLKTVREIMLKEDGFDASQKLDEWGMAKYKPRDNKNKARNSPGEESSRTQATSQQHNMDPGPSAQQNYLPPDDTVGAPGGSSWAAPTSSYNVAGWQQQLGYHDPHTMPQGYSNHPVMSSSSMSQDPYYNNYPNYPQAPAAAPIYYTSTTTADYNYSQAPVNTPMMGYQANADEEYSEQAEYQDSIERSPTDD